MATEYKGGTRERPAFHDAEYVADWIARWAQYEGADGWHLVSFAIERDKILAVFRRDTQD